MTEDQLHITVAEWLRWSLTDSTLFYHCPNGGHRGKREAARLKMMGTLPGVADLTFIRPGGLTHYIELKSAKGRMSPEQIAFKETVTMLGCPYAICRSLDDVAGTLKAWDVPTRGRFA